MIQVGKPVKGNQFIGREKEIAEIIQYLKMGQSVVITAPRRFGKTSLVIEVLRRLRREKYYTGFVDIFEKASLPQLAKAIIGEVLDNNGLKKTYQQTRGSIVALLKNAKLRAVIDEFEFILGMEDPAAEALTQLGEAIDFVDQFSERASRKIAFALDEYGDILKYEQALEIIKLMRAKIQQQDHATYLFSGSYESVMNTLFIDSKSPFYRLARTLSLGYLAFDDVQRHMVKKMKEQNVSYDQKLIEDVIDFLKGHPYYCQLALQQMYLYQVTTGSAPGFDELLELIVNTDKSYIEKIWEGLSKNKEHIYILKHLSSASRGIYSMASEQKINASRALKKLEGQGIIYQEEGGYYFYDPILQYWIATRINQ